MGRKRHNTSAATLSVLFRSLWLWCSTPTSVPLSVSLQISRVIGSYFSLSLQLIPPAPAVQTSPSLIPKAGLKEAEVSANKLGKQEVTRPGLCSIAAQGRREHLAYPALPRCSAPYEERDSQPPCLDFSQRNLQAVSYAGQHLASCPDMLTCSKTGSILYMTHDPVPLQPQISARYCALILRTLITAHFRTE